MTWDGTSIIGIIRTTSDHSLCTSKMLSNMLNTFWALFNSHSNLMTDLITVLIHAISKYLLGS